MECLPGARDVNHGAPQREEQREAGVRLAHGAAESTMRQVLQRAQVEGVAQGRGYCGLATPLVCGGGSGRALNCWRGHFEGIETQKSVQLIS